MRFARLPHRAQGHPLARALLLSAIRMRPTAAVALALLLAPCACQGATAIVVEVTTDLPCGTPQAAHVTTAISVGPLSGLDGRPPVATTTNCDAKTGRIGSLVVVPSEADDAEIGVRVLTAVDRSPSDCDAAAPADARGCIVARRALRFLPHDTIDLPIEMTQACDGVVCAANETCSNGACAPATMDLPPSCASTGTCDDGGTDAGASGPAAPPPAGPGDGGKGGDAGPEGGGPHHPKPKPGD